MSSERVLTALTTLQQYETLMQLNKEYLATLQLKLELLRRQADAGEGNAAVQARIEFGEAMLEARKAQAETAELRQEALRLLLDGAQGVDRIWRARFEAVHEPGLARLREMRAKLDEVTQRVGFWK